MFIKSTLNTTGDTIVEVLLAIAVVSAVLGGAFASANRSLVGSRQAQERGEATKLIEAQLEQLKEFAKTNPTVFSSSPNPFCIFDTPTGLTRQPTSHPRCRQGTDGRYALEILRSGSNAFRATASWDKIGGGQERATIHYRIYQE